MANVSDFMVRSADGVIDEAASLSKFQEVLADMVSEEAEFQHTLSTAVDKVFEAHGSRLPKNFLVTKTLEAIAVHHSEWSVWEKKIDRFLKGPGFVSVKGNGGGISRV
ncbi:MAG: hypothetical protein EBT07_13975 [Actinobacteria bacterium]|nr:hypothetical protein [Actinomycetota bacterium]